MSLNWNVEDVKDYETVCFYKATVADPNHGIEVGDRCMNGVTSALIWLSLATMIGHIREDNAAEVYARIKLIEKLDGAMMRKGGEDYFLTREDVQAHIGLSTNASFKDEPRSKFLKRTATRFLDEAAQSYTRQKTAVDA